ncbi:hypothetical protein LVB87_01390 [Lysobacter sp. KIS68-7]|uniref:hypothetical protein n=1 Tax=Lysobacter sp. KIS68-7 TaxID=2904252 RepID=UPI001E30686B|nr:hypothetical protein [Lysobacter sp. KIS68-7]UHQ19847.1 hypothetical protein LVB87_01390 [Lysobacter sp. KIS68-7]
MEHLAHLSTFVSLIYGLGVANVLAHLASLIKRGKRADWYWVHTLWSAFLLLAMASFWWLLQNWARVPHISYLTYLSMLLIPSLLFMLSDLLFPDRGEGAVNLKAHFFAIKRPLFLLLSALVAADTLDSVLKGWQHMRELGPLYWSAQVFFFLGCLVCARSGSERVQGAFAVVTFGLYLVGISNALASV